MPAGLQMNQGAKENLKIVGAVILTLAVLIPGFVIWGWFQSDWDRWAMLVFHGGLVFGVLGYQFERDLKRWRCAAVFAALFCCHIVTLALLLTHDIDPSRFGLVPLVAIDLAEIGIGFIVLVRLGGAQLPDRALRR